MTKLEYLNNINIFDENFKTLEDANYNDAFMMFYDDLAAHYYEIIKEESNI